MTNAARTLALEFSAHSISLFELEGDEPVVCLASMPRDAADLRERAVRMARDVQPEHGYGPKVEIWFTEEESILRKIRLAARTVRGRRQEAAAALGNLTPFAAHELVFDLGEADAQGYTPVTALPLRKANEAMDFARSIGMVPTAITLTDEIDGFAGRPVLTPPLPAVSGLARPMVAAAIAGILSLPILMASGALDRLARATWPEPVVLVAEIGSTAPLAPATTRPAEGASLQAGPVSVLSVAPEAPRLPVSHGTASAPDGGTGVNPVPGSLRSEGEAATLPTDQPPAQPDLRRDARVWSGASARDPVAIVDLVALGPTPVDGASPRLSPGLAAVTRPTLPHWSEGLAADALPVAGMARIGPVAVGAPALLHDALGFMADPVPQAPRDGFSGTGLSPRAAGEPIGRAPAVQLETDRLSVSAEGSPAQVLPRSADRTFAPGIPRLAAAGHDARLPVVSGSDEGALLLRSEDVLFDLVALEEPVSRPRARRVEAAPVAPAAGAEEMARVARPPARLLRTPAVATQVMQGPARPIPPVTSVELSRLAPMPAPDLPVALVIAPGDDVRAMMRQTDADIRAAAIAAAQARNDEPQASLRRPPPRELLPVEDVGGMLQIGAGSPRSEWPETGSTAPRAPFAVAEAPSRLETPQLALLTPPNGAHLPVLGLLSGRVSEEPEPQRVAGLLEDAPEAAFRPPHAPSRGDPPALKPERVEPAEATEDLADSEPEAQDSEDQLAGNQALPRKRPYAVEVAAAVIIAQQADGSVLAAPRARPKDFANRVAALMRHREEAAKTVAARQQPIRTTPSNRLSIPSNAPAARTATISDGIELGEIALIGIFGKSADRRALLRTASGEIVKVRRGDRVAGWAVSAISEDGVRITRSGSNRKLLLPN